MGKLNSSFKYTVKGHNIYVETPTCKDWSGLSSFIKLGDGTQVCIWCGDSPQLTVFAKIVYDLAASGITDLVDRLPASVT